VVILLLLLLLLLLELVLLLPPWTDCDCDSTRCVDASVRMCVCVTHRGGRPCSHTLCVRLCVHSVRRTVWLDTHSSYRRTVAHELLTDARVVFAMCVVEGVGCVWVWVVDVWKSDDYFAAHLVLILHIPHYIVMWVHERRLYSYVECVDESATHTGRWECVLLGSGCTVNICV